MEAKKTFECRIYEKAKKVSGILTNIFLGVLALVLVAGTGMAIILTFAAFMSVVVGIEGSLSALVFMIAIDAIIVWVVSMFVEEYFKKQCEETKKALEESPTKSKEKVEETPKSEDERIRESYKAGYEEGKRGFAYEAGFTDGKKEAWGYVNALTFRRKRR